MKIHKMEVEVSDIENILKKEDGFIRADGRSVCRFCLQAYHKHPMVKGYSWLTRLCTGKLVKL